jgi:hypothetical protein
VWLVSVTGVLQRRVSILKLVGAPNYSICSFCFCPRQPTGPQRHLLTGRRLPNIVVNRPEKLHSSRKNDGSSKARTLTCLTLAILFLYNPFLGMASSDDGLNIRHNASHRATVGASELQHFSPTSARKIFSIPVATRLNWMVAPVKSNTSYPIEISTAPGFADPLLCADLWFRPPPSL